MPSALYRPFVRLYQGFLNTKPATVRDGYNRIDYVADGCKWKHQRAMLPSTTAH